MGKLSQGNILADPATWRARICRLGPQPGQERGKVGGVVLDMLGRGGGGGDMNGAHPHRKRCGQIARIVLEHRGALGDDAGAGENGFKGGAFRLWTEGGVFDAVDPVEQPRKAARLKHPFGIGCRAIGVDDLLTGQCGNAGAQGRVRGQMRQGNVMHINQIGGGVQVVFMHQPGQRGAIKRPVMLAQMVGMGAVHAQSLHHEGGHADLDLIEQPRLGWIKRVVEVKDPIGDMSEVLCRHRATLAPWQGGGNGCCGGSDGFRLALRVGGGLGFRPKLERDPMQKDAYMLILEAIDNGIYRPGDRLVESELAERLGVSRTPVREALQRLETQSMLARDGRSLIVASLDHNQLAELYVVRAELEALAARLAAKHAAPEEIRVLRDMVAEDRTHISDPEALSRANRRFHKQIHLASHNRYLVQQLELVHRSMALLATTSLAVDGRGETALAEHQAIVDAISAGDADAAQSALRVHISKAFETRLKLDAGGVDKIKG